MHRVEMNEEIRRATAKRADHIFNEQQQQIFERTDRSFAWLMIFQWFVGIVVAFIISPRTEPGQYSQTHVWTAIFLGGAIAGLPVYMAFAQPGRAFTRHAIAIGQMLTSALLIYLTGGRIETHFHVFGSLAFLAFYRDWRVLVSASTVVALDHLVRGIFWPQSVFEVLTPSSWRWLEYAAWVIFEDMFLIRSCFQSLGDMRQNAERQAELEATKDIIEAAIIERTTELKASEERFRLLTDTLPVGIFQSAAEGGNIYCNPRGLELMGLTMQETLEYGWIAALHPEDRESVVEEWSVCASEGKPFSRELRFLTPQGRVTWVNALSRTLWSDDGQVIGHVGIIQDITDRKLAEEALRRSERKSRALFNNIADPVFIADKNTFRFIDFNRAVLNVYGYSEDELRTMTPFNLHAPEYMDLVTQAMKSGAVKWPIISEHITKDGRRIDVEILAAEIEYEERPARVAIVRDITQRKRAEAELKKAKEAAEAATMAKSEFLASMSHEIRTPMNAIIGMTSLLIDTDLSGDQRDFAETIRSSSESLLTIINDILDFSKIESGKLDFEHYPFDLRDCVEESLDLLAAKATEKGLDLAYLIDAQTPSALIGDATRVRQILVNLLSNAVKFTHKGEIVVSVAARPLEEKQGSNGAIKSAESESDLLGTEDAKDMYEIHFAISDTGIGIPEDRMDRLFKSFSQVDASTTRNYGGTGLGLAISKHLVELMGGRIWVESKEGSGSTFHFTIVAEPAPTRMRVYLRGAEPDIAGRRVLIVDDSAANRRILTLQTESWGMTARAASFANEALEWVVRGDPFDIAILDMQMPDMDGLSLAAEIRKYRDKSRLPLVMLTSMGRHQERDETVKFDAFLIKPIKPSNLYSVLIEILSGKTSKRPPPVSRPQIDTTLATRMPLRILIAEDNVVNQKVALKILERLGYRADIASNGLEVIETLYRQHYDVVLMDVQMPEMDGLEASRLICQEWSNGNRPRIIAMTANAMQGDRERCLAAGMDDYISKPVKIEELQAVLERSKMASNGKVESLTVAPFFGFESPSVDFSSLASIVELESEEGQILLKELIPVFQEDATNRILLMRKAIEEGAAGDLRKEAHALKGCSANVGAKLLSRLCADLERRGNEDSLEGARQILKRAEIEFEKAYLALKSKLRSSSIGVRSD